jgi:hypothetical protein
MNRLRNSLKGSSSPAAPAASYHKQDTESELEVMVEEDLRRKPAPELDLQLISDDARSQFADILGRVEGQKDIVIQPELMSLLDHVTPIGFLKK